MERAAYAKSDYRLVARRALFVHTWMVVIDPHLMLADRLDMRLDSPPRDARSDIYSVALATLPQIEPGQVLIKNLTAPSAPGRSLLAARSRRCAVRMMRRW